MHEEPRQASVEESDEVVAERLEGLMVGVAGCAAVVVEGPGSAGTDPLVEILVQLLQLVRDCGLGRANHPAPVTPARGRPAKGDLAAPAAGAVAVRSESLHGPRCSNQTASSPRLRRIRAGYREVWLRVWLWPDIGGLPQTPPDPSIAAQRPCGPRRRRSNRRRNSLVMNGHRFDSDRRLHLTSGNPRLGLLIMVVGSSFVAVSPNRARPTRAAASRVTSLDRPRMGRGVRADPGGYGRATGLPDTGRAGLRLRPGSSHWSSGGTAWRYGDQGIY